MDTRSLATALLRCGTLDADSYLDLVERHKLSTSCLLEDIARERGEAYRPTANDLIDRALRRIAEHFLGTLPSRVRLHATTLDYEVYTNHLDSTLQFDDERIEAHFQDWLRHAP